MNVLNCLFENVIEVVKAIDVCHIDILIKADAIMNTQFFCKKIMQMSTDCMEMYDYHKKGKGASQKIVSTSKKRPNDVQKIPTLAIDAYEGDLF